MYVRMYACMYVSGHWNSNFGIGMILEFSTFSVNYSGIINWQLMLSNQ